MKTKNKTLAVVEIAIVLCSMLLVATLPAITTASEEDLHYLGIYGNANQDDTIDMRDTTYIKLAIFGKKPKTDLADANYDGKVSMLDVGQTKLIILGKEKKLTFVDDIGTIVTVTKPVDKIVTISWSDESVRALGAKDRVVGVGKSTIDMPMFFPELSKKPCINGAYSDNEPDIEKVIELEPDVVFGTMWTDPELWDAHFKGTDIVVVRVYPRNPEWGRSGYPMWPNVRDNMIKLGYILDEEENAREYAEWYDSVMNTIVEIVAEIPEDKKPKVFLESAAGASPTQRKKGGHVQAIATAGGRDIAADIEEKNVEVEWVIEQNPDVIIGNPSTGARSGGYATDDDSDFKAYYDEIVGLPGYDLIMAVQDGRVHIIEQRLGLCSQLPIATAYIATWLHPELFEDLDPQAIHQEYVDTFCPGLDFDVRTEGVFVYPPIE